MTPALPEAVNRLLREHMTSFERLAVLILLRDHKGEDMSVAAASNLLRISEELVHEALIGLEASGLVRRTDAAGTLFRLAPTTAELTQAVEELGSVYREQSAAVMSAMSVNAIERIRTGPLRAFADAFLLGKRDRDG